MALRITPNPLARTMLSGCREGPRVQETTLRLISTGREARLALKMELQVQNIHLGNNPNINSRERIQPATL